MTDTELLRLWRIAKREGTKRREFAKLHGITFRQLRAKLERARLIERNTGADPVTTTESPDKNTLEITHNSDRIKTLDQLLESCRVDPDTWTVESYTVNKWDNAAVIEGAATITELYQVKARLTRIKPLPIVPVITPVRIEAQFVTKSVTNCDPDKSVTVCLFDAHFGYSRNLDTGALVPFHDSGALSIALDVIRQVQPGRIILGGDWLDLAEWSDRFIRSPEHVRTTQPAINALVQYLALLRQAVPTSQIDYIEGNHEARLPRAMATHLSYAYDLKSPQAPQALLSVPMLLGLEELGIKWHSGYPDNVLWAGDGLMVAHGDKTSSQPGGTVGKMKSAHHIAMGHIHRAERAIRVVSSREGHKTVEYVCPGCLCRTDFIVPGNKPGQHWAKGFLVVTEVNGQYSFEVVRVESGQAWFRGEMKKAQAG